MYTQYTIVILYLHSANDTSTYINNVNDKQHIYKNNLKPIAELKQVPMQFQTNIDSVQDCTRSHFELYHLVNKGQ